MRKTYLYMTAVAMSAALAAGCQKAEPAETTAAAETVAESTGTGMAESESSETSGTAAQDDERLADYHLLQGIVTGTNDEKGTFTLKADDGGEYVITTGNIGDVETEIADDSLVVIGYIGVEIHDNMDQKQINKHFYHYNQNNRSHLDDRIRGGNDDGQCDEHVYDGDSRWN